ncbi:trehalose-phosphatase [Streptomyces olivaceiscleroticus]|uniref:Trehalose 6-phosphate phosphatase n=1 Tax=Streptomyces olivaceiscleroticus TaxID=68245 RepID=A0ABN1B469_9ACTN
MGSPENLLAQPVSEAGRAGLATLLARPAEAVVALDFDGTLADIVPDPEQARAHPGVVRALARLAPLLRAVVVITGRPAETAVRLGGFADAAGLDHLVVLGHYGAERWDAATGRIEAPAPPPGVAAAAAELPALLADTGAWRDASVEDAIEAKGGRAVAVHTRRTADPQGTFDRLRAPLAALADRHGLIVEPGRFVLELRPPGVDKGVALTSYVREVGAGAVLYAGDDLGDLAAYAAVDALRAEGQAGVLVCSSATVGEGAEELADRADLVVPGPQGVVELLTGLAEALARP